MAKATVPSHGFVLFLPHEKGTEVRFRLKNFEPHKTHAIHIHEFQSPSLNCAEMGGHFNPSGTNHGSHLFDKPHEHHAGDLINNFTTDQKGNFQYDYIDSSISVSPRSRKCILGRSLVIHGYPDDLGRKGQEIRNQFVFYKDMKDSELIKLCSKLNYKNVKTREERIQKLEEESLKTGNAGVRIACGNINKN